MLHALKTKRVYLPAEAGDGFRALVDRLWPRGEGRGAGLFFRKNVPRGTF